MEEFIKDKEADKYVNDVLDIYESPVYLKTLKDSGYTVEEIKEFLNHVKSMSKECYDNVQNQRMKILSYVLDNKTSSKQVNSENDKINKLLSTTIQTPNKVISISSNDGQPNVHKDIDINNVSTKKYILSSLSQDDYNKLSSLDTIVSV